MVKWNPLVLLHHFISQYPYLNVNGLCIFLTTNAGGTLTQPSNRCNRCNINLYRATQRNVRVKSVNQFMYSILFSHMFYKMFTPACLHSVIASRVAMSIKRQ
ncbi:hypothetical protein GDO86_010092 [Hymenochirus boettgeri]|uniref:Uncharacterized protein n=1 Tax=Hymenochirus boettgeri TaxID=247094 RepID=A0A8T2JIU7_9PIPI|nr:hypothetical protein GDO86_010092 [Hymenochirus boettgeri]